MVSTRGRRSPGHGEKSVDAASRAMGLSTGWNVFSYLIAGMAAYGGIGWLIGHFTHISLLFPIGMVVGLGISVGYIIYRYGRGMSEVPDGDFGHGNERGDDR